MDYDVLKDNDDTSSQLYRKIYSIYNLDDLDKDKLYKFFSTINIIDEGTKLFMIDTIVKANLLNDFLEDIENDQPEVVIEDYISVFETAMNNLKENDQLQENIEQ